VLSRDYMAELMAYLDRTGTDPRRQPPTGAPVSIPVEDGWGFPPCPVCGVVASGVVVVPSTMRGGSLTYQGCEHTFRIPAGAAGGAPNVPAPGRTPCGKCKGTGLVPDGRGGVKACDGPRAGHF
jgi:hypothetical protein